MTAVTGNLGLPAFPSAPTFSFFEYRVAEEQLVNSCFRKLGHGWWGCEVGNVEAVMKTPCWDPAYDWDAAYEKARASHKSHFIW